jgi:hypothetical protein
VKKEIPEREWIRFLDEFSLAHEGWLVSIDVYEPDQSGATEAVEQPLVGVTADRGGETPSVSVVVGRDGEELTRLIHGVRGVRINRTEDGAEQALEIEDRDGRITVVRFRSAVRPETVDGVVAV